MRPALTRSVPGVIVGAILLLSPLVGAAGSAQAATDIDVGGAPAAMAVDPLLHEAFVLDQPTPGPYLTKIRVFDTRTGSPLADLWGDYGSASITVDPVGSNLILSVPSRHLLNVVPEDPSQGWSTQVNLGDAEPQSIAVDYATHKIFATTIEKTGPFEIHRVMQIELSSDHRPTVSQLVRLGNNLDVGALAVDTTLGQVYVANTAAATVSVVSERTGTFAAVDVPVGSRPTALGVDQQSHDVYVADSGSDAVSVINGVTHLRSTSDIALHGVPTAVTVDPIRGSAFVAVASHDDTYPASLATIAGAAYATTITPQAGALAYLATDWLAHRVFLGQAGTSRITPLDEP